MMCPADIDQVAKIDREAFPTQWPAPNFRRELRTQLAHYIIACDDREEVEPPAKASRDGRLISRLRKLFHLHSSSDEIPPADNHKIVGFVGFWVMADESHITNIAVRQDCRRCGIGELLLISAIDLTKKLEARIVTLEVRTSNKEAQGLYVKHGFNYVGVRQGYYLDNREDALLMSTEDIHVAEFQAKLEQLKQTHATKWGTDSCQALDQLLLSGQ
jgi:ribosomal-protein-alanine N-acetyltransferase